MHHAVDVVDSYVTTIRSERQKNEKSGAQLISHIHPAGPVALSFMCIFFFLS
jgi:hypothetical protein